MTSPLSVQLLYMHCPILHNLFFIFSGAPGQACGRQAIQMRGLSQTIQPQDGLATTHVPAHGREAVRL